MKCKRCKISSKGPQKGGKMAKIEPRSPKCKGSAPNQNGETPKSPPCAEINRASPLEASWESANMMRNGEPPKVNGEPTWCAKIKIKKLKTANQDRKGESPNENGEPAGVADSSRCPNRSASSSQTASRRSVRRTHLMSPNRQIGKNSETYK